MSEININDIVIRLDLDCPHIYLVKAIEPDYVKIIRYEGRKQWFTLISQDQIRLATKSEIYQGYKDE